MSRLLSALLVYTILQIVHASCPDGFELAVDGQCNKYYGTMALEWSQAGSTAIAKCKELQAQPVIIHNEEQQSYWTGRSKGYYILLGLMCNTKTSKWEWADGSAVDYKPAGNYDTDLDQNCRTGCTWYIYNSDGYWNYVWSSNSYNFDIYCTSQLPPLPVPSADGCESFEDDSDDGVCYQIGETSNSFDDAQKSCLNLGSDLASIHNLQENSFVRRLAVPKGAVNGVLLGATTFGKGNGFEWTDGSEWDFNNFYPGFPVDGFGDCVVLDTQGTSGEWVNVDCNTTLPAACMRPKNLSSSTHACPTEPPKEGQLIYSPGFPFNASTPCDFMLSVEAGRKVELEIVLLEANSCCDRAIIYENYFGGNIIANLTGEVNDKVYTTSASNYMKVSWQPNGGVNVRGMVMRFRGI